MRKLSDIKAIINNTLQTKLDLSVEVTRVRVERLLIKMNVILPESGINEEGLYRLVIRLMAQLQGDPYEIYLDELRNCI